MTTHEFNHQAAEILNQHGLDGSRVVTLSGIMQGLVHNSIDYYDLKTLKNIYTGSHKNPQAALDHFTNLVKLFIIQYSTQTESIEISTTQPTVP